MADNDGNTPAPEWYATLAPEEQTSIKAKGWDKLPADQLGPAMFKAYRGLEQIHGIPADRIVAWPRDASDTDGWGKVYDRMGVPKTPAEYKFEGVAVNGKPLDETMLTGIRQLAADLHLPAAAAPALAQRFADHFAAVQAQTAKDLLAANSTEQAALDVEWGGQRDHNMFLVGKAFQALGFDADITAKFAQVGGYGKMMKAMLGLAQKMSEPDLLGGRDNPGTGSTMTLEQALEEKRQLFNDSEWANKYIAGDKAARERGNMLDSIIAAARFAANQRRPV